MIVTFLAIGQWNLSTISTNSKHLKLSSKRKLCNTRHQHCAHFHVVQLALPPLEPEYHGAKPGHARGGAISASLPVFFPPFSLPLGIFPSLPSRSSRVWWFEWECHPWSHTFEHSIPRWWHGLGRLRKSHLVRSVTGFESWRSHPTASLLSQLQACCWNGASPFLFLTACLPTTTTVTDSRPSVNCLGHGVLLW